MTKEAQPGLENVAALILERQRLENWLATLDAKRGSTPDNVYQRVRGDYAARLKMITEHLIARHAALKAHVDNLNVRLTQFETEAKRLRDVRAESEVRMQVGELSVSDWNVKARECDEGIGRLTEAQAVARASLAQAREILSMVSGQTKGVTPSNTPLPGTSRPVNLDQLNTPGNGAVRATPVGNPNMNELDFLNSVVGGQQQPPPPQTSSDGTPMPNTIELEGTPPDLGQSMLNRLSERTGKSNLREDGDADSLLKDVGTPKPGNRPSPLAANVTESNPIVLKPQGGPERHKTLKCQECGTMNYPTEWYCERCGAELAAV
jgi:hypothetical protein